MSMAKIYTAHMRGPTVEIVTVEVDISNGLNSLSIVGLGDRSVAEAKDRISAAIKNSGFTSPKQKNQKVIISLGPAGSPKIGTSFDLAMALAYLAATKNIPEPSLNTIVFGETSLSGELRKSNGLLPVLCSPTLNGFSEIFIPKENEAEGILALEYMKKEEAPKMIYAVERLSEAADHISARCKLPCISATRDIVSQKTSDKRNQKDLDFAYIHGNDQAKRAIEIAISGHHHIILCGPPGTGKTLLARSSISICPDLDKAHAIEVASIYSAAHMLDNFNINRPPFRAPHHTASYAAIIGGGGNSLRQGEITLAHRGIFFADEFPEFSSQVLEGLRQPLEEGSVTISRSTGTATFPARCMLIAAMNPCPCGRGDSGGCVCSNSSLDKYRRRISGPIAERIDIWIDVASIPYQSLCAPSEADSDDSPNKTFSKEIRERISRTRLLQRNRFIAKNTDKHFNSEMSAGDIESIAQLSPQAHRALESHAQRLTLSSRSIHKMVRVARTIADMDQSEYIQEKHLLEALTYRRRAY